MNRGLFRALHGVPGGLYQRGTLFGNRRQVASIRGTAYGGRTALWHTIPDPLAYNNTARPPMSTKSRPSRPPTIAEQIDVIEKIIADLHDSFATLDEGPDEGR